MTGGRGWEEDTGQIKKAMASHIEGFGHSLLLLVCVRVLVTWFIHSF